MDDFTIIFLAGNSCWASAVLQMLKAAFHGRTLETEDSCARNFNRE